MNTLHIIFDGPPSHESGRFIEVENSEGISINAGEWRELKDGLWELIIKRSVFDAAPHIETEAEKQAREFLAIPLKGRPGWPMLNQAYRIIEALLAERAP